jgi:hypothetical protein
MGTKVNLYKQSGTDDGTSVNFNLPRSLTYGLNARANDDGGVTESDNCEYNTLNGLSTLLKSSSLIITPNSYKEGKLYSVIPSSGAGDMSVVRATTATRVNSAGLVELVPYNLLQYSEDISNSIWFKSEVSVTSSLAPDGSSTAYKLTPSTSNNFHYITQYTSRSVGNYYTLQIYAKADGYDTCRIATNSTDFGDVNLTSLSISLTNATGSITDIGNGWRRILITSSSDLSPEDVYIIVGTAPFAGNGTSGIFICGAQLVEGTQAKDYQRTETRLNIPRLDYSNGSCPSLLVEPQRTNLVTYSSSFDNSAYNKTNVSVTANTSTSPDGTQNADTITSNASSPQLLSPLVSFATSTSVSLFVKYVSQKYVQLFGGGAFGDFANFDLENAIVGTIGASTTNAKIENYGNGWLRISAVFSGFSGSTTARLGFTSALNSGWNSLDSAFNKSVLAYGFQIEAGTYATSYIPTTSATVTRNQDQISKTGISSLIGTEFTLFFDGFGSIGGDYSRYLVLKGSGGTYANFISIESNSNNFVAVNVNNASATNIFYANGAVTSGQRFKLAVRFKNNDFAFYLNGSQVATQTSATVPTTSDLYLGYYTDYADNYNEINSAVIWPTSLTNDQLEALTGTSFNTYAEMASYYNYTLQ